ncbi:HDOD domain-containing protein [Aquabacterium sp.]|uniref:HDOD domain-containing protein n=1 Tax=Aquabacterium sp. TaxID=1872578 RepID=UPI003D6CB705
MSDSLPPLPVSGDNPAVTLEYLLRRMRHKSDFPTLSSSVSRIQALSEAENESLGGLCDEILKDVALTQKLLRLINTPHYRRGGGDSISTVSRAVSLIGLAGVRNLALSLMLVEHMEDKKHAQQLKEEFLRTVMAGTLASELCTNSRDAEDAFIGSLFRNLGRLLAEFYLPDEAQEVRELARPAADGTPASLSEAAASAQVLGMPFEDLGQAVGQTWALPDRLLTAMKAPTGTVPTRSQLGKPEHQSWLATLANAAADAMLFSQPEELGKRLTILNQQYASSLELKPSAVQDAAARARKRLTELTKALKMEFPKNSQAERLLDHFYVDAPNAGQTEGPGPEALGLDEGELAAGKVAVPQNSADVLTSGIQDITNTMVDSFKLNDILRMILETIYRALDCRRVIFCMRDAKTMQLIGRIGLGHGADGMKAAFQIPLRLAPGAPADLFTAVSLKGADTLISDASAEAILNRLPVWFRDRVQAPTFLLLPMVMKHQGKDMVLGLIYADKAQAGSLQISEKDLSLLRTLRNQAVMAFKQTTGG